jgi:hypothetical protein
MVLCLSQLPKRLYVSLFIGRGRFLFIANVLRFLLLPLSVLIIGGLRAFRFDYIHNGVLEKKGGKWK